MSDETEDIVEEYVKEVRKLERRWDMNRYLQKNYRYRISTLIGEMDLTLECLPARAGEKERYMVDVERCKYSPFNNNGRDKEFFNLNDAKEYFNMLKERYNGVKIKRRRWF